SEFNKSKYFLIPTREIENYLNLISELAKKDEKLEALIKASSNLMLVVNKDKIIVDYIETSFKELLYKPEEFLNRSLFDILPEYLAITSSKIIDQTLSTGRKNEFDYELEFNNQKRFYNASIVKKNETEVFIFIQDITDRKKIKIFLENEIKFNSLLYSLSLKFINCKEEELDKTINEVLREIGNFFQVDRVYIFEFDFEKNTMSNTYEWCAPNVSSEIDNLQNIPIDFIPDFSYNLIGGNIFLAENVNEIEDENLKNILTAQGILSIVIYPIFINDECYGYVGFDSVKSYRTFTKQEHDLLTLLSNFLGNVFQKVKTERELKVKTDEIYNQRLSILNIVEDLQNEIEIKKKIENDLKISEQRLRTYIEQTRGIIFSVQRDGRYSYISPAVKDILGEDPDNIIGKKYTTFVHPDDVKVLTSQLRDILLTHKPVKSVPIRLKHKDGHYVWTVIQAGVIYDNDGIIKEILGIGLDVNELMETKRLLSITENRYQSLFENQIEAYAIHEIITDENDIPIDYRFIDVNKSFLEVLGLSDKSQIVNKTVREIWPDVEQEWIQIYGNIALNGGSITLEKYSKVFNKTFLINAYSQGDRQFAISFFDITDRKRAEIIQKIQLNIANAIIYSEDLKQILLTIKNELGHLLDTTNFFVARYNEAKREFKTLVFIDEKDEYEDVWSEDGTLSSLVIKNKSPLLLRKKEIEEIDKTLGNEPSSENPEIWLGVPILLKRKSVGVIVLQSYTNPNAYDQTSVDLLQTIASQLATYIEQQEFESQIKLLSKAIEQSSVMVIITDRNNIIQFVNRRFFEITGYSESEVYGKSPRILKSGYHSDEFYKNMWSALSEGKEWRGEILNKDKNGKTYWVSSTISPIFGSKGEITNYIAIQEDITEKRKLLSEIENSEKKLRTTWESSIDGMRLTDENGIIIDVNQALCNLYGVEREKLIGKPFYYLVKNYQGGGLKAFYENIKNGKIDKIKEYSYELETGKILNVELTNSIIKLDDGKLYLFSIFRDITEKKKIIKDLIEAKEKAEEMNRLKSQFFANMSHELRTPFMGILGYTELLRDHVEDEEAISYIDGIERSSKRMIETLTSILDLSKYETNRADFTMEHIEVDMIILETCEYFKHLAKKKNLDLNCKLDLPNDFKILANTKLFRSILNNLLSNAIKFTQKGKIDVNVYLKQNDFILEVIDTGIGIPKDKHQIVFDEFRQVSEGHSRAFEGTGLGLSIVKKFTELLGGQVLLESELDKGSKFSIILPIR
ncbi:MAG: PAS domain S-box protein, partial [Ignavibacterium sp.]|nr:PAS domain S-box protein [Ignavibacterium sp.]